MTNEKFYVIIKIESRVDQNLFHIIFLSFGRGFPLMAPAFLKRITIKWKKYIAKLAGMGALLVLARSNKNEYRH